jgi:uncharacterized protein YjlB
MFLGISQIKSAFHWYDFYHLDSKHLMKSLQEETAAIQHINIVRHILTDDGKFPNNGLLPLLIYQHALESTDGKTVKEIFESNGWVNAWEDGVFDFDHYHSQAHEVLGVISGSARIQFGGPSGIAQSVEPGDVIIIPAGVAHRFIEGDENFTVVGAYPEGQTYDVMYGETSERPKADERIRSLHHPINDPLYGLDGPLQKNWNS